MTNEIIAINRAFDALVELGFDPAEVTAVLDSLCLAGLELEQPESGPRIITAEEFGLVCDQLGATR